MLARNGPDWSQAGRGQYAGTDDQELIPATQAPGSLEGN
jgi:hypothetical protein